MQARADDTGVEITAAELYDLFEATYFDDTPRIDLKDWRARGDGPAAATEITLTVDGITHRTEHRGVGPVAALTEALAEAGYSIEVLGLTQQSTGSGNDGVALTYVEYRGDNGTGWACGRSNSVLAA